jgi:lipid II:glycine glycyltransferase (peptidoglycan interpeptide bridge formation enzyme)
MRRERIHYVKVQPPPGRSDIEPMLLGRGFVQSDLPAAPVATVRLALDGSFDHIIARMRPSTRANIRRAERDGVIVRQTGAAGLPTFGELIAATSRRQGFTPYPLRYYAEMLRRFGEGQRAELLLAVCRDEALSGAIIIGYGRTVVYKMSAWSGRGAKLHPNEATLWRAIQWAHDRDYRFFDLEGILEPVARAILAGEELPEAGRTGTTAYKLGMGGQVMLYPPAYDRSFNPLLIWPTRLLAPRLTRFSFLAHRMVGREG